jgi:hypothetical protein
MTSMPDTVALLVTASNVRLILPNAEGRMCGKVFVTTRRLPDSLYMSKSRSDYLRACSSLKSLSPL